MRGKKLLFSPFDCVRTSIPRRQRKLRALHSRSSPLPDIYLLSIALPALKWISNEFRELFEFGAVAARKSKQTSSAIFIYSHGITKWNDSIRKLVRFVCAQTIGFLLETLTRNELETHSVRISSSI